MGPNSICSAGSFRAGQAVVIGPIDFFGDYLCWPCDTVLRKLVYFNVHAV